MLVNVTTNRESNGKLNIFVIRSRRRKSHKTSPKYPVSAFQILKFSLTPR